MSDYLLKRIVGGLFTLLGVSLLVFLLVRLLPGDPARLVAGLTASPSEVAAVRTRMGLDEPLWVQYGVFASDLLRGDLGRSMLSREPVITEILARFPATAQLALVTILLTAVLGVALGIVSALYQNRFLDRFISLTTLLGISLPSYALGLFLIYVFAVRLRWLPAAGADGPTSIILPALTLTLIFIALLSRITRVSLIEVFSQDYIRVARAKGLSGAHIVLHHALKNALIPVLTVLGLQLGALLSGAAILTETVFGWPGIGLLMSDAIFARDYPTVQALVLFNAFLFVALNIVVDLLYAVADPRVRYS